MEGIRAGTRYDNQRIQQDDGRVAVMNDEQRDEALLIMSAMLATIERLNTDFAMFKQAADDWRKETELKKDQV